MVNSCFVLICVYPPSSYSYTLFNFGYQKTPPQKKYDPAFTVSKDINWRQLTSNYIFFSKCNKRKRKIKGKNCNIEREREQERERESERKRKRNRKEELFFNKGSISGLILLGKVWTLNWAIAFGKNIPFFPWLQDQLWKSWLQF